MMGLWDSLMIGRPAAAEKRPERAQDPRGRSVGCYGISHRVPVPVRGIYKRKTAG